ncbi:MAG TPA: FAD-binding oxidoreductase [Gammaproteobacteria bacterium]|nr:FAD-binding oxidoreductase [Gammaproteobacteria bacterium]
MSRTQFPITLVDSQEIAPGVRHLSFTTGTGTPFTFIPGQFINLHFSVNGEMLQRSYSIATISHAGNNNIELALSHVSGGRASEFLFNMPIGHTIEASGPFGRLVLRDDEQPKRYILVATGTGVTPYRAMLPNLAQRMQLGTQVAVVLGARSPGELLYQDEFLSFMRTHPLFSFYGCCSRVLSDPSCTHERRGYVQETFAELALIPGEDIVYLCGNPHMVDQAYQVLLDVGFEKHSVRREKYVFSH